VRLSHITSNGFRVTYNKCLYFLLPICYQFPGSHSGRVPPDTIPNSEVKTLCADDSVGSPYVKVGHCQDLSSKPRLTIMLIGAFFWTLFPGFFDHPR
jgi:hypothetical protein